MATIKDVQLYLVKAGYDLGNYGPNHDGIDGDWGTKSIRAMGEWQGSKGLPKNGAWNDPTSLNIIAPGGTEPAPTQRGLTVPVTWMPKCSMQGIVVHWTAGVHNPSQNDREHYHILIDGNGDLVRGIPTIDKNARPIKPGYAAHTLNCNTGFIGVSLACMANAVESPFNSGSAPMTRAQWYKLPFVLADLCARYNIKPDREHVLSHAEVESTLGIKQRGKWDIARLSFDLSVIGAHNCGDIFRAATAKLL